MIRWVRLRMLLGDHNGLLILLAIFGIFICVMIGLILLLILHCLLSHFSWYSTFDIYNTNNSNTDISTIWCGLIISLITMFTLIPISNITDYTKLSEYQNSSQYLKMKNERYTKFVYTPRHHNDGLFNDPQASVSFIDRDTKKSKTFITTDTGEHSKPNDQMLHIPVVPENANLLANIRYTNGKKYLIYEHYAPKRKLNKIETAVYHNKRQYSDIVYAYISVNNKN